MKPTATPARALPGLLALLLALLSLAACSGEDDSPALPVLQAHEDGSATLTVRLDAQTLQAHAGQTARLFALSPGEDVSAVAGRQPLDEQEVAARLRFPVAVGGSGLYCTYAVVFSDGTPLAGTPLSLSNPEILAADASPFPHANTRKGLYAGDEELSRALYSTHTAVRLDLAALLSGSGVRAELGGIALELDAAAMAACDAQVAAAADAGMQVTLEILPDPSLSLPEYAVLLDLLAGRYAAVSAIVIGEMPARTDGADGETGAAESAAAQETAAAQGAELYRLAYLALVSRRAGGRVYLAASGSDAGERLLAAAGRLAEVARYPFGGALCPAPATAAVAPQGADTEGALLLSDIAGTVQRIRQSLGQSFRFCVTGVEFPADDPSLQAALMTYCYRAAGGANADFVILGAQSGSASGLYGADMLPRTAAGVFAGLDSGENPEGEALADSLLGEEWRALGAVRGDRLAVHEAANPGTSDDPGKRWMSFSGTAGEDYPVFRTAGSGSAPGTVESGVWGAPVLSAALLPTLCPDGSGYRCTLPKASDLSQVYVLSACLMPQSPSAARARVTLRLDGTAADGRALSCTASAELDCNTWQDISFHIRGFTSQMDDGAPCTLTLTVLPLPDAGGETSGTSSDPFALLLRSMNLRTAAANYTLLWVALLVLGGFGVGFLAVLLPARRRRSRR